MIFVVGTHALVWHFDDSPLLGREAGRVLEDETLSLVVSVISLAELKYLASRRRLAMTFAEILELIQNDKRLVVYPVSQDVIGAMPTDLNIHDALICGTALVHKDLGEQVALL